MLTSRRIAVLLVGALLAGAALSAAQAAEPSAKDQEAKLLDVLKSDAKLKERADACRLLARVATKDAVPALVALLGDAKLSHMARYALEPIPDPAVDDALRAALATLKGRPLVGVIGSIGVRRDAKAVDALAGLLGNPDADVAQGAARALGKVGTQAAADALVAALATTPKANQLAVCEGLFRAAEALAAQGQKKQAMAVYDRLRALKQAAQQVRAGALRGAVLTRGDEGVPLLVEAVRGADFVLVAAAARTAMELPAPAVTKALADELPKLPVDKQVLITLVLGKRGDAAAVPALLALAKAGDKAARVAAIRALPEIGDASAAPALVALLGDADSDVAKVAKDALGALAGPQADAAIAAMLKSPDPATRRVAIDQIAQRRSANAIPALLKAAEDPEPSVRVAGLKALGIVAEAAQFPTLLDLLLKAKSPQEIQAAEGALSALCVREAQPAAGKVVIRRAVYGVLPDGPSADVTKKVAQLVKAGKLTIEASNSNFGDPAQGTAKKLRIEYTVDGTPDVKTVGENDSVTLTAGVTPPAFVDALCAALAKAPVQAKLALLRALRAARGAKALDAVRAAAKDPNAEVRDAATSTLCGWSTADALPDLTRLAKTSTSAKFKILALRGVLRLIPLQDAPVADKLAALKDALPLATRRDEKRLALSSLGLLRSADALELALSHLDGPQVKEEACLAAVSIAERLGGRDAAQVRQAMQQVLKTSGNRNTKRRAQRVLARVRPAARRK